MGLICYSRSKVSFLTSLYFIGFGFGMIFFNMTDLYGRKFAIIFSMTGYLIAMILCLMSANFIHRSVSLFMIGFFHLKISASFVFCMESIPNDKKSIVTTFQCVVDSSTMVFVGIYFVFVKNWFWY